MKVTVCALTYRRPDGLERLLDGLAELESHPDWDELAFVIVDNDPETSGRNLCDRFHREDRLPGPLHYISQPVQGIGRSRNAALDAAADSDWAAFIDDDEKPDADWLIQLYEGACRFEADVVGGPVEPVLEGSPPAWVVEGGFFERRKYDDGAKLGHVFTNNVLFRPRQAAELNVRFDERPEFAALRVGEDRLFFQTLASRGARTHYCTRARVREWIPAQRANEEWLVARMNKIGRATAAVERHVAPGAGTRVKLLTKAIVWLILGALTFILGGFAAPIRRTRARRHMAYGRGLFAGSL